MDLEEENEMAYLEFIHNLVETMDKYFENVCELDIMYNIEKAHYILDEMIMNGQIVETNKTLILAPLHVLDKITEWSCIFCQLSVHYKNYQLSSLLSACDFIYFSNFHLM